MEAVFIALVILGICFTVFKLIRQDHWTIRFFDFPLVQIVLLNTTILIGYSVVVEEWTVLKIILFILLALCILNDIRVIYPYTTIARKESKSFSNKSDLANKINILVSNVYQNNEEYAKLLELIDYEDPDIVITLETNKEWEKRLNKLEKKYPFNHKIPLENMYGMHLFSRLKLANIQERYLIQEDVPSLVCDVQLPGGREVKLYSVHPKPPSPTENEFSTSRDGELYKIALEIQDIETPVIVAGDLNDVAWSHSTRMFQRLSGLRDPRKGRGFFNTFNANIPLLRWPLDHIFHSAHFGLLDIKRHPHVGSDHFPMGAELILNPLKKEKDEPAAEEEELEEAREKIVEAEE